MRNSTEITKRSRGRPRAFIPSEVLDRVRTVFMEKGFAAASLDELAAASGLNRPSLYAAFGDKEQLYIAALRFYGARSVEGLEAILDGREVAGALVRFVASTSEAPLSRPAHSSKPLRPTFGWDSLTEAEHSVSELVAEGFTNREVAATLFL